MNVLGIFVRQPLAGRVKTRLAESVGAAGAARLYSAFISDVADRLRRTAGRRFLCFEPDTPDARDHFSSIAAGNYELWPQPPGTLGERLARFFDDMFADGAGRVVVIGSDSPTLPREFVERAFSLLDERDVVLGPAADGGFYLVGQRRAANADAGLPPQGTGWPIFDLPAWSTAGVLSQTVARVNACGARLALLPLWYDVDSWDDLLMLRGHVDAIRASGERIDLPRTEPLLRQDTAEWDRAL
jgi:rSAM/selenodomain-associated transferase 1